ncbi:MAG: potassium channel protein [bacterium]
MRRRASWILPIVLIVGLIIVGTIGFSVIEKKNPVDALFLTMITLTTVGYSDYGMHAAGRVFTIAFLATGMIIIVYSTRILIEYMVGGNIIANIRRRRMEKTLEQMKGHTIICGYGKIGQYVASEFVERGLPFVVICKAYSDEMSGDDKNAIFIDGDATDDEMLLHAGVERAGVLVAAVAEDADNLFITMTARGLNPEIRIVARVADTSNQNKFLRAGANMVICPYELGGRRIATAVINPSVTEFLDTIMRPGGLQLRIDEMIVKESSAIKEKSLMESNIRKLSGAIILAVKKRDGGFIMNPSPETRLEAFDILIALGTPSQITALQKVVGGE